MTVVCNLDKFYKTSQKIMVIREQITIQAFINHNMLRLLFYNTALLCYLDNIAIFL